MTTDIVDRLRDKAQWMNDLGLQDEAADEIERLRALPMTEAIKLIEKMRDVYIVEHCQTYIDGHWVGTAAQNEYVAMLDDILAQLHLADEAKP